MSSKEVVSKIRMIVSEKGHTLEHIGKLFRKADTNHDGVIDQKENLPKLFRELGVNLTDAEVRQFARFIGASQDGVKISQFLRFFTPEVAGQRLETVDSAYSKFSITGQQEVSINDLIKNYKQGDYIVISGRRMTPEHFISEVTKAFDPDRDGKISQTDFQTYYFGISERVDSDQEFIDMVKCSWS